MNFGFRFHLASLMSIFLSLFLGILIGAALFQDSALVEEQGLVIEEMELRFSELQANLGVLRKELEQIQTSWQFVRNQVLPNQLEGRPVVFLSGEEGGTYSSSMDFLKLAGADVRTLNFSGLEQMNPSAALALVVPASNEVFTDSVKFELQRLSEGGSQLIYLVDSSDTFSEQKNLPRGWQIPKANNVVGEIALILSLITGKEISSGLGS